MKEATLHLYEHTEAIQLVEEWILEHDEEIRAAEGVLPAELAELLAQAQMGFKEKAESVALMVQGFLASAAALQAEVARLTKRRQHFEKAAQGLKEYLRIQLALAGEKKIQTPRATMWRQLAAPSVEVDPGLDLELVAHDIDYMPFVSVERIPEHMAYSIDKQAVLSAQKSLEAENERIRKAGLDPAEDGKGALPSGIRVTRTEYLRIT